MPTKDYASFEIVLLNANDLGSTWETAWPALQEAYPGKVDHRISMDQIETYNWTTQVITLTPEESKKFYDVACSVRPPGMCFAPFLVVLDETPVYGGMVTFRFAAPRMDFPVIYPGEGAIVDPEKELENLTLNIRPYHSTRPISPDDPAWERIRNNRIKNLFLQAGKLIEE